MKDLKSHPSSTMRSAIIAALPAETTSYGNTPPAKEVYIPVSHIKALRLECSLVIGNRGVGKTFWSAALGDAKIRKILGQDIPDLSNVDVHTGFGDQPNTNYSPDGDIFTLLLDKKFEPYHIWRAVLARWLVDVDASVNVPTDSWEATVTWVRNNPEPFARLLENTNTHFSRKKKHGLIVFDALDRSSTDWQNMDGIVRDLLRVVLSLKRFSRLHGKIFLRFDQFSRHAIADFPDASKLLNMKVDLTWTPRDLHGLLWQYLCNGPEDSGKIMRETFKMIVGSDPLLVEKTIWSITGAARNDEKIQRKLFIELAGEWMGRDRRRGVPYTWAVGHLSDGRQQVSPRSFLAAIRAAAEDSGQRYSEHPHPLHYESIKRGIQQASQIRVAELAEDYPWVKSLMKPLSGINVPCEFETIKNLWENSDTKSLIENLTKSRLPPEHLGDGWNGMRLDLENLGIFDKFKDGRVNMPDLYRVGFGLGRKGGVKPMAKTNVN